MVLKRFTLYGFTSKRLDQLLLLCCTMLKQFTCGMLTCIYLLIKAYASAFLVWVI